MQILNGISEIYNSMLESNPSFKKFVKQNQNKSVDVLCQEFDIKIDPKLLSVLVNDLVGR